MKVGDLCERDPVIIDENGSACTAAELMRVNDVTCVVVVEREGGLSRPVGLVTAHDLVTQVVAANRESETLNVAEIMSTDLIEVDENATLWEAAELMRSENVRQLPVLDEAGYLLGVFRMDDVLQVVTAELADLLGMIGMDSLAPPRQDSSAASE
ncbi:CBS domain-containing protein [Proteobacteria bacterium 005FR1]|nr:CBS domain-containing protein [Proteobacteria bacterium 005FR1]